MLFRDHAPAARSARVDPIHRIRIGSRTCCFIALVYGARGFASPHVSPRQTKVPPKPRLLAQRSTRRDGRISSRCAQYEMTEPGAALGAPPTRRPEKR